MTCDSKINLFNNVFFFTHVTIINNLLTYLLNKIKKIRFFKRTFSVYKLNMFCAPRGTNENQ